MSYLISIAKQEAAGSNRARDALQNYISMLCSLWESLPGSQPLGASRAQGDGQGGR
jgi:hypothetical protein